jgi:hypothetical protein
MGVDTFGKGPPVIATPNWSDEAEIVSYTGFASDEDAERLLTMQPSDRAQCSAVSGGCSITLDRGESYPANLWAFLFGNITGTGSWAMAMADSTADLDNNVAPIDTAGGWNSHLRFDGANATAAQSTGAFTLTSYSISARVRADLIFSHRGIVKFGPAAGTYVSLTLDPSGYVVFRNSVGTMAISSLQPLTLGQFYRVTGTYNSGTGVAALIVDGISHGTAGSSVGAVGASSFVTLANSQSLRFAGSIDDVRLWDTAQSAANETTNMVAELPVPTTNLVGYWKLNELSGTSAANAIGGGPALTLSGSPLPYWSFPEGYWTSPGLDSWPRRHSLFFDPNFSYAYRYARLRVLDPQNVDPVGFLHFGRLYGSAAYQLSRGLQYGSTPVGYRDPSIRSQLPGGQTVVRRATPAPISKLRFWSTDEEEMHFYLSNLARIRGGSRDALWVLRPFDELYRHQSMIYGLDSPETDMPVPNYGLYEHAHVIEGLI